VGSSVSLRPRPEVSPLRRALSDALTRLFLWQRRLDPYYRDAFDALLRGPIEGLIQGLIASRLRDDGLGIAQERLLPGEAAATAEIVSDMSDFLRWQYPKGGAERAGNTKTYGVVRGVFEVLPGLPTHLRRGVFAEPRSYRAWVRFGGPGPLAPPDIDDNGILSIGIKLMGVDGPKLIDDERQTQDFTGISSPTFTTPNVVENAKLQRLLRLGVPVFYFVDPTDSHYLDAIMQGLYSRVQHSPLEVTYWSCVAYLHGEGQAVHYAVRPRSRSRTPIPRPPGPDYLREAMARTLGEREVTFDFLVQLQTDPHRMPIEDASVRWSERLSPMVPVATLRLPVQRFDSPAQLAFAGNLSFNPWHSLAEHRPLGNQSRARHAVYLALSRLRQQMNAQRHLEPTGDERFD
jgi:hypothetical protein